MKSKIIIDVGEGVGAVNALAAVLLVVNKGHQSEAAGIPHYCWHTLFKDGTHVSVRRKRKRDSADSFYVYEKVGENQ